MILLSKKWWTPVLLWTLFAGIQAAFFYNIFYFEGSIVMTLTAITFQLASFYINDKWLFNRFSKTDNSQHFFVAATVFLVILAVLNTVTDYQISKFVEHRYMPKNLEYPWLMVYIRNLLWLSLMLFISSLFSMQQRVREEIERNKIITEEKLNTELSLMKAQINPHFLFNALNNIFSLSYMKSDKAPEAILKLSGMLRYVLDDCNADKVPISSEVSYIRDYGSFQQLKFKDNSVNIDFDFKLENTTSLIAPMLIIPFIENSFKYSQIEESPNAFIKCKLQTTANSLVFKIVNSIPKMGVIKSGSGLGIENIKKRLNIIYPGKHTLGIDKKDNTFTVNLTILLV